MTVGLILAGGRSRRFGADKALARLRGVTLLERAHARLAKAADAVAVSAPLGGEVAALAALMGAPVLEDPRGAPRGPLSGVLAGLDWALNQRQTLMLTRPVDAPLLPDDLEARLLDALGDRIAAVACSPDGMQPLCALWRTDLYRVLKLALADGLHPPVHRFLEDAGAVQVAFPDDWPFLNTNTPADLAWAEQKLGKR